MVLDDDLAADRRPEEGPLLEDRGTDGCEAGRLEEGLPLLRRGEGWGKLDIGEGYLERENAGVGVGI